MTFEVTAITDSQGLRVSGFDSEVSAAIYCYGLMRIVSIGGFGLVLGPALAALLGVPSAAPAHAAKAAGQELKAREAFAAGRYDEALDRSPSCTRETLHPVYLRNIGRCHQKMRQPDKAIDAFREYLAKDKKLGAEEHTEIEGYIKEMEALRDEQAKAAAQKTPPPSVSPVNSPPPPPANLQPLPPTVTASATLVSQAPPQEEAPVYKKWWFWTGIGVVAVGGVVAAVLLSSGGTTRPDCPAGVTCKP